jgi:hypothetical protein
MLRYLPLGVMFNLFGGILFGFGVCLGTTTFPPTISAIVMTGLGAISIGAGYFVLRPLLRKAKAEIKAVTRSTLNPNQ